MRQREQHDPNAEARLIRELRAIRPRPSERFAAELDERAAAGFAGETPSSPRDRLGLGRLRDRLAGIRPARLLAPAGAVATLAVVVSVAAIQSGGVDGGPRDASLRAGDADGEPAPAPPAADPSGAAELRDDAVAPGEVLPVPPVPGPGPGGLAPGRENRVVERSATLALSSDAEDFPDVADGVIGVADRYRGFVISSQESSSGETSRATFELAIPSQRLQQALADLSSLAHVEARTEDSLDITAPTVSARARLADARTEVASLRRQLAEAESAEETRRIRARLDVARSQAASARTEVRQLARRARFATVAVTVTADGSGDGDWGVEEALDDAGSVLSTAAGVTLVSLAVLLPLALVIAAIAFAARRATSRSRERALDGS